MATPYQPIERRPRIPTGTLGLTIEDGERSRHWHDRKQRPLEDFLNDFVGHLFIVADWMKQRTHMLEVRRKREIEEERAREVQRQQRMEEEKILKELCEDLDQWRLARDIREYVRQMHDVLATSSFVPKEDAPISRYLRLATSYADRIDPVVELRNDVESAPS